MRATKGNAIYAVFATPMTSDIKKITQNISRQYQGCKNVFEKKIWIYITQASTLQLCH